MRALTVDGGVDRAVLDGRRAVELAESGPDEILTAALAACARALFFAGELDEASAVALQALEHPDIERRVPSLVVARSTSALVARRARPARRRHEATPRRRRPRSGEIGTSRSWLGANASVGSRLGAGRRRAASSRPSASSPPPSASSGTTSRRCTRPGSSSSSPAFACVAAGWTRRRRRCAPPGALLDELADAGLRAGARRRGGARARAARGAGAQGRAARAAERSGARGAPALDHRPLGARDRRAPLPLARTRSGRTGTSLYRKLGVHSRAEAVARAAALGLLDETESPG